MIFAINESDWTRHHSGDDDTVAIVHSYRDHSCLCRVTMPRIISLFPYGAYLVPKFECPNLMRSLRCYEVIQKSYEVSEML